MKNRWITGVLCLCLLNGCMAKKQTEDSASERYRDLYEELSQETSFDEKPEHYSLSMEMTALPDDTYRYYVVIDSPQTAMYDVTVLVVENDIDYGDSDKMMPSAGIFDEPGSLVPGQVDKEKGYVKGIALSGESQLDSIDLRILVSWTDADHHDRSDVFHQVLTTAGISHESEESGS